MCSINVTQSVNVHREPGPPPPAHIPWKRKEHKRAVLAMNAARKHPRPICRNPKCGVPFDRREGDVFDDRYCCSCGLARTEKCVYRLLRAKSKRAGNGH